MAENHVTKRNHMCFLNETQYIGRIKSVSGDPQMKFETFSSLASIGDMEIPTGEYEALTINVEFDSVAPADLQQMTKNGGYVALRCTCDIRIPDVRTGTRRTDGIATRIWGFVKNPPMNFHSKAKTAYTAQIATYRVEVTDVSGRIFELDFVNGVRYPEDEPGSGGITVTF